MAMGLFDNVPVLGGLFSTMNDNAGMLMGFGGGGFEGATQGMRIDEAARQQRIKQAEAQAQRQALQALGAKMGAPAGIANDDRALSLWIAQNNHKDAMAHQSAQDAATERRFNATLNKPSDDVLE